jgi:transcriptional regulator with XRE-family HTH domain
MSSVETLDLATTLRALRRRADLSQRELAQRAGIPPSTISRLESGEVSNPRIHTLEQVVKAAGGAVTISPNESGEPIEPVPHDHLADARGRRYPAHLDVRTTFPFIGKDWQLLTPGTPVRTFSLNRNDRDQARAGRALAAALRIEQTELLPDTAWCWTAFHADNKAVAHLAAQIWPRLNPYSSYPANAVVCGMAIDPKWHGIGVEERLLARLRDEIADHGVSEVAVIGYRLGDAAYLRAHGFRLAPRVIATFNIDLGVIET